MTLQDATRDATDRWAGVPTPQVEGPIAYVEDDLDNRNHPFFLANDLDLAGRGYVAEEFFYAGKAKRYDAPLPTLSVQSPPTVTNVISSGHEYKTRLVVYPTPGTLGVSVFLGCSAFRVLYVFLSLFLWWCRRRAGMGGTRVSRRVRRAVPRSAALGAGVVPPS